MIWFFIGIIIITFIINKITLTYGLKNLDYSMEIQKNIAEIGEEISITSVLENKKPLSISFLQVQEKYPEGLGVENHNYSLFILPYQRVKRTYKITGTTRGFYQIRNVTLGIGDFIGFKMVFKYITLNKEIVILPKRLDMGDTLIPLGSLNGSTSVKRWIIDDPLMTLGIREYTGNEPERHIHWPSSLKYGNLMVRNFDFTTDNSVIILLNIESVIPFWDGINKEAIEKGISIVRGIMEELENSKIPYGFATNAFGGNSSTTQFYYPGLGKSQLNYLLEVLGRINYGISSSFERLLENIIRRRGNYTTFVVVTPKVFPSYIKPLNDLSKSSTKLIVVALDSKNTGELSKNIIKYGVKL